MPSQHKGTLTITRENIEASFEYDGKTHVFYAPLQEPPPHTVDNVSATLMLGGNSLQDGFVDFTADFGPAAIVIAMNSISASINVQLTQEIPKDKISGSGDWVTN